MLNMLDYIKKQKSVDTKIIESYKDGFNITYADNQIKKVLVIATGSSLNSVLAIKNFAENICDISIDVREPFQFAEYERVPKNIDLTLAVTLNGTSLSTVRAIRKVKKNSNKPIISVTSAIDSPITKASDYVVDMLCGKEEVRYSTMGVSATIITLIMLFIDMSELDKEKKNQLLADLQIVVDEIDTVIEDSITFYNMNKSELIELNRSSVIGYGSNLGTVKEAETKFTETVKIPSQGFELEAYMHGPIFELKKDYGIFIVQQDTDYYPYARGVQLENFVEEYCDHVFNIKILSSTVGLMNSSKNLIIHNNVGREEYTPILGIIPFQIFAYFITLDKGIDLSKPVFPDFRAKLGSKIGEKD